MDINKQINLPKVAISWQPILRALWWLSLGAPLTVLWVFGYWGHVCPIWMDLYVFFSGFIMFIAAAAYTAYSLIKRFDLNS